MAQERDTRALRSCLEVRSREDAPRPVALTVVEQKRNWRSNPDHREHEAARKRARRALDKVMNQPYTLLDMALGKSLISR